MIFSAESCETLACFQSGWSAAKLPEAIQALDQRSGRSSYLSWHAILGSCGTFFLALASRGFVHKETQWPRRAPAICIWCCATSLSLTSLPTSSPSLWKLRRCHSYPHSKIELVVTQRHVSKVKITTSDPSLHADCYNELTLVDLVAIGM